MQNDWTEISTFEKSDFELVSPWIMCQEALGDAGVFKLVAEGEWKVVNSVLPACGPDGSLSHAIPDDQLIIAKAPFAALIGKIGGNSAFHKIVDAPSDPPVGGEAFAVGAFCVLKRPDDVIGPLFIGLNTLLRPIHVTSLKLTLYGLK